MDRIVEEVLEKYLDRSRLGIKKYGLTLAENNQDDFLNHLQEECMDSVLYLQKLKDILKMKGYKRLEDIPDFNQKS